MAVGDPGPLTGDWLVRNAFVAAVAFNVDVEGFDPTQHVFVKQADAAIAKAESGS